MNKQKNYGEQNKQMKNNCEKKRKTLGTKNWNKTFHNRGPPHKHQDTQLGSKNFPQ